MYSQNFLLKIKNSDICKQKSELLKNIDLSVFIERQPIKKWERNVNYKKNFKSDKKPDIKKITSILNKLSLNNFDLLLKETQEIEYTDPEVVSIIFNKAVSEPFFSELYAEFCFGLTKLHSLIRNLCTQEFKKIRNKNICRFIGELYKLKLIYDLESFINYLKEDLDEQNIEILCELINTINPQDYQFSKIIDEIYSIKTNYSPRYKFMIMDLYDFKTGKRIKSQREKATFEEYDHETGEVFNDENKIFKDLSKIYDVDKTKYTFPLNLYDLYGEYCEENGISMKRNFEELKKDYIPVIEKVENFFKRKGYHLKIISDIKPKTDIKLFGLHCLIFKNYDFFKLNI